MNVLAILSAPAAALMLTPVSAELVTEGPVSVGVADEEVAAAKAIATAASAEASAEAGGAAVAQASTQSGAEATVEAAVEGQASDGLGDRVAERIIGIQANDAPAAEAQAVVAPSVGVMPVQLVLWDGDFELMKTSRRLRIWRSHIAYNLSVDAAGNATGCELTETFRMRRVSDTLCEVLMAHHTFEPAKDADGAAVAGTYSSRISYQEMLERL